MLIELPEAITIGALHRQFTLAQGEIRDPDTVVNSFTASSEEVRPGSLFIACRGSGTDGHSFIQSAFDRGAHAAVVADIDKLNERPGFQASNARVLLSRLSAYAFNQPSKGMQVIGITGTNGKTSINWMIYNSLRLLGQSVIRIGTLGYEISGDESSNESLTTPSAQDLQKLLSHAKNKGCKYAVLEVSSHALHQHRVDDVLFDATIFTNITHDHLDYHRTFDEYLKAKKRIFELLKSSKKTKRVFSVNLDTSEGRQFAKEFKSCFEFDASFGYSESSAVEIKKIVTHRTISEVELNVLGENVNIQSSFIGKHNAENIAAAVGVLHGLGFELKEIATAFSKMPPIPGRLESYAFNERAIFIDYAHTPDALKRILECLKEIEHKRLIVVFGCGGDRDWRKRPVMGAIAAQLADIVFVTSDNPRNESPEDIIKDILDGELGSSSKAKVVIDRAEAIKNALSISREGDLVLIAGKGHEDYQIIGDQKKHFSDQEEIKKFYSQS